MMRKILLIFFMAAGVMFAVSGWLNLNGNQGKVWASAPGDDSWAATGSTGIPGLGAIPPVINVATVNVVQGATVTNVLLANVTDDCGLTSVQYNSQPPTGILVSPNVSFGGSSGTVTANVTVTCSISPGRYQIGAVTALDNGEPPPSCSGGGPQAGSSALVFVNVTANPPPTIGTYQSVTLNTGTSKTVSPSAAPSDPNFDLKTVSILPATLPGGGDLSVDIQGMVAINTTASTTPGTYPVQVTVSDTCTSITTQFNLTVVATLVNTKPVVTTTGEITVSQGGTTVTSTVATATDEQEPAGDLKAALSDVPDGLTMSVSNNGGSLATTAKANCAIQPGTYDVTLTVTDNGKPITPALSSSTSFKVNVTSNVTPTIGSYQNISLIQGGKVNLTPSDPPADGNKNIASVSVEPLSLPGDGTLAVDATTGVVSITTTGTTTPGSYPIRVRVLDTCGAEASGGFTLTVNKPLTKPAAPSDLTAVASSSVQIDLTWKDNSDNEMGFIVERRIGPNGTYAVLATTNANIARFSDSGLTAGIEYFYRVRATNSLGQSDFSNESSAIPPQLTNTSVKQFYPLATPSGKTISITGSGFIPGATQVFFGGERLIPSASVNVVTPSQLQALVPPSGTGNANINGFITVRVLGEPDVTTKGMLINADNPGDPTASFPEFILLGDVDGDGDVNALDVTRLRAGVLRQVNLSQREMIAGDAFPLNANGSRGDGDVSGIDVTALLAAILRQLPF